MKRIIVDMKNDNSDEFICVSDTAMKEDIEITFVDSYTAEVICISKVECNKKKFKELDLEPE